MRPNKSPVLASIFMLATSLFTVQAQTLGEDLNATNLVWTTGGTVAWFWIGPHKEYERLIG